MQKQRDANRTAATGGGYDAAVARREDDVLRRWPFAAEVYRVIASSPPEWSTRVGVYAPWGVGKTSVLKFVETMAVAEEHLVVWFNPWMHGTSEALWQAFVHVIANALKTRTGKTAKGAWKRIFKSKSSEVGGTALTALLSISEDPRLMLVGTALGHGVDYLRHFFKFGEADVEKLRAILGEKRLIVLIDDLDRADPRLVPEILLALKEILDVPSVAFVCAFDPDIVGQAMNRYHEGFGDGLEFLEKIIDYPCWLPEARREDLERLALIDAARYCPTTPAWAIRRVLPFVTATPRSVRQFVRGLRLLETNAGRYHEEELSWVVSLCGQVLQFRLPKGCADILADNGFWTHLAGESFMASAREDTSDKILTDIRAKVDRLIATHQATEDDKGWLVDLLNLMGQELSSGLWLNDDGKKLLEAPSAVTVKELQSFLLRWNKKPTNVDALRSWLNERAQATGEDAHDDCLHRLLGLRDRALSSAYQTLLSEEQLSHLGGISRIDDWIRVLLLDLGQDDTGTSRWSVETLNTLKDHFSRCSSARDTTEEITRRNSEKELLLYLIRQWAGDLRIWADVIGRDVMHGEFDGHGNEWRQVWRDLHEAWNRRLADQLATEFTTNPELVIVCRNGKRIADLHVRELLEDASKPFWSEQRTRMQKGLSGTSPSESARLNAFALLEGITGKRRGENAARTLLSDPEIAQALFAAATSRVLVQRGVQRLLPSARWCEANAISITLPDWWHDLREEIDAAENTKPKSPSSDGDD